MQDQPIIRQQLQIFILYSDRWYRQCKQARSETHIHSGQGCLQGRRDSISRQLCTLLHDGGNSPDTLVDDGRGSLVALQARYTVNTSPQSSVRSKHRTSTCNDAWTLLGHSMLEQSKYLLHQLDAALHGAHTGLDHLGSCLHSIRLQVHGCVRAPLEHSTLPALQRALLRYLAAQPTFTAPMMVSTADSTSASAAARAGATCRAPAAKPARPSLAAAAGTAESVSGLSLVQRRALEGDPGVQSGRRST